MTKIINKIGGYASIVLFMGGIANHPAQATLVRQDNPFQYQDTEISTFQDEDINHLIDRGLQEAHTIAIALTQASDEERLDNDNRVIYRYSSTDNSTSGQLQTIAQYTDIWSPQEEPRPRRKVPEPSPFAGLIAVACLLAAKKLFIKST